MATVRRLPSARCRRTPPITRNSPRLPRRPPAEKQGNALSGRSPDHLLASAAADPNRTLKNEGVWVGSAAAEAPEPHREAMWFRTGGPGWRPEFGPG